MIKDRDYLRGKRAVLLAGIPDDSGVYALWLNGSPEYVGKSQTLLSRLFTHIRAIECDRVTVWPCAKDQMGALERDKIAELNPRLNKNHSPRKPPVEMRNVITIPSDLHQALKMHVVLNRPSLNMGTAAEEAIRQWLETEKEKSRSPRGRRVEQEEVL